MMYLHNPSTIGHQNLLSDVCEGYAQALLIYERSTNEALWTPMERVWRLHKAFTNLTFVLLEAQLEDTPNQELIAEIYDKMHELRNMSLEAEKKIHIEGESVADMLNRCREHFIELWGHD